MLKLPDERLEKYFDLVFCLRTVSSAMPSSKLLSVKVLFCGCFEGNKRKFPRLQAAPTLTDLQKVRKHDGMTWIAESLVESRQIEVVTEVRFPHMIASLRVLC